MQLCGALAWADQHCGLTSYRPGRPRRLPYLAPATVDPAIGAIGLAFALTDPNQLRRWWRRTTPRRTPRSRARLTRRGWTFLLSPTTLSVDEMTANLVEGVRGLAAEYYPEVTDALNA